MLAVMMIATITTVRLIALIPVVDYDLNSGIGDVNHFARFQDGAENAHPKFRSGRQAPEPLMALREPHTNPLVDGLQLPLVKTKPRE